jgi:hypothetical protein
MNKGNHIKEIKNEFKQKKKEKNKVERNYSFGFIVGEYN